MFKINFFATASFIAFVFLCFPQELLADTFKSETFLTWNRDSQDYYIRTSIGMASLISAQNDKAHAKCLDDWYYKDEGAGNDAVLATMKRFPEYHPRGVILAVMQKRCGSFNFRSR